mgnify:CR=1 FL=1
MLVTGEQAWICDYLTWRNTTCEHPDVCQTFGWLKDDCLVGALAFHHANERNIYCDIALEEGRFPRKLLHVGLWYAFGQLKCRRLTFFVSADNLKSIALVKKLGAYREATLQDGSSSGEAYIYCLRPENCLIWSKLNGQVKRKSSPGT